MVKIPTEIADQHLNRIPQPFRPWLKSVWNGTPNSIKTIISRLFLKIDSRLAVGYDNIDWRQTKLFARSSMGPLYVNLQGRFPKGCVSPSEYETFLQEAIDKLLELRDSDGRAIFARVLRGREIHPGSSSDDLVPDLVVEPAHWSDHMISGFPSDPIVRPISEKGEYGTHTPDGVWVMAGPNIRAGSLESIASIKDVVPTLLTAWGLPISKQMNGQILQKLFKQPQEVQSMVMEMDKETETNMPPDEQEEILNRLRALGYLD
ncbi:MAG: hypothetical protein HC806_03890 [Anaerolineae bacterium]|nr:hypothetical protein [Anaerolineae bacterium]